MFCTNCGKEIDDKAVVCVGCGVATKDTSTSDKSFVATLLLWFFLGSFGAHRFYVGKVGSGTVMLLCLLFCWLIVPAIVLIIWIFVDLISILTGSFKAADGQDLAR